MKNKEVLEVKLDNGQSCLNFINDYITKEKGELNIFLKSAFVTVKKDLNRLEKVEQELKNANEFIFNMGQQSAKQGIELEKLEKVVEIAKHRCIIFQVVMGSSYEGYVKFCEVEEVGENAIPTREEYELVKEVLEDENK